MDDRLTMRTKHGAVLWKTVNPKDTSLRKAIRKLADYEDTGLTPEEVSKIQTQLIYTQEVADAYMKDYEQLLKLLGCEA